MKLTARTLFAGILSLIVAGAVLYGIILAGSPSEERDRQFDGQRLGHLQQIAAAIDAHYQLNKALPESFETLAASREFYIESVTDPKTHARYEYRMTSESAYELCATFAFDSEDQPAAPYLTKPFAVSDQLWKHPAGHHCFPLNAKKQEAGQTCDIYRACQQGQTCAKLPSRAEAICVVAGQECIAAGCPGACQLLESYPVQVRCDAGSAPVRS